MCIYVYVCIYVFIYIYIYNELNTAYSGQHKRQVKTMTAILFAKDIVPPHIGGGGWAPGTFKLTHAH